MSRALLKEAIADAKAVKDAAIANAKAALEEAFSPHLQELLSNQLEEMDDYKLEEEDGMSMEEGDLNLEELLAELEEGDDYLGEEEEYLEEEDLYEAKGEEGEEPEEESKEEEIELDMEGDNLSPEVSDKITQIVDDVIEKYLKQGMIEPGPNADTEEVDMEDIDMTDMEGSEDMDMKMMDDEEVNIDELLMEFALEEAKKSGKMMHKDGKKKPMMHKEEEEDMEKKAMKEELEEAYSTIRNLRADLNEVNLLNAKLLYTNKIFKAKNLTESQKVKVLSTFDKAGTVKEAKLVYESLVTSLTTQATSTTKAPIKESMGFASKASSVAGKQATIETDAVIARMKKLAGL